MAYPVPVGLLILCARKVHLVPLISKTQLQGARTVRARARLSVTVRGNKRRSMYYGVFRIAAALVRYCLRTALHCQRQPREAPGAQRETRLGAWASPHQQAIPHATRPALFRAASQRPSQYISAHSPQ